MPWRCTPPRPEAGGAEGGTAVAVDCRLSGTGISPGRASQAAAGHALSTSTPAAMPPGLSNSAPVESHWVPSTSRVPSPRCPPRRLGARHQSHAACNPRCVLQSACTRTKKQAPDSVPRGIHGSSTRAVDQLLRRSQTGTTLFRLQDVLNPH